MGESGDKLSDRLISGLILVVSLFTSLVHKAKNGATSIGLWG